MTRYVGVRAAVRKGYLADLASEEQDAAIERMEPAAHSPALADAIAAASLEEACPACAEPENLGLCHSEACRSQVLPRLKRNAANSMAHHGRYGESSKSLAEIEQRVAKVERPARTAALKRQLAAHIAKLPPEKRGSTRLAFAIAGVSFRNRRAV